MRPAKARVERVLALLGAASVATSMAVGQVSADSHAPAMLHPRLTVQQVTAGLVTPVSFAFTGPSELLVTEKNTGLVKHIRNGEVVGTALDLAVNARSERGLLGIALHPGFPADPGVYLYWTESSTGADTAVVSETSLLGNRVDRFVWDGSALTFDRNIIRLRAIQQDAGQPQRGNHNGGVLRFGPDGKLYVFVGDVGRRGQLQNLACGPTVVCPGDRVPDDAYGGPEPDDAHLSGVVLRLNDDGTTPADNPFHGVGAAMGGEVGANFQRVFSYGHRNGFGMAFHPKTGELWMEENGDDSFSELNRVLPGMNGGWVQLMGPVSRVGEFKHIETTFGARSLQQIRWDPSNIADTPEQALARLFMLPGAHYSDPEFSWKYEVAPAGIGFVAGRGLGPQFAGALFVGAATPSLQGGYLFHLRTKGNGTGIAVDDPRLEDRVADNLAKHDLTESESLLIGRNFGIVPDLHTGPDGALYAVSLTRGALYRISAR